MSESLKFDGGTLVLYWGSIDGQWWVDDGREFIVAKFLHKDHAILFCRALEMRRKMRKK